MKRKTKKMLIVQEVINLLTDDEDLKQDLWVCYLSGVPFSSFPDYINKKEYLYTNQYLTCDK